MLISFGFSIAATKSATAWIAASCPWSAASDEAGGIKMSNITPFAASACISGNVSASGSPIRMWLTPR